MMNQEGKNVSRLNFRFNDISVPIEEISLYFIPEQEVLENLSNKDTN